MKLSFSTSGWEKTGWNELFKSACEMRFDGIEVYDLLHNESFIGQGRPFSRYSAKPTYKSMRERGIVISCFDTDLDISQNSENNVIELQQLITIAHYMHCKYISVRATGEDRQQLLDNISRLISFARQSEVTLLVKTSGPYADSKRLLQIMDDFACDQLAALWDVNETIREGGESPAQTIKSLGAYVRHVHIKDSCDDGSFALVGEGTLPINGIMDALNSINYNDFVSLEWRPEWMPSLTDKDIIFPHYVNFMERFIRERTGKSDILPNHDRSGYYIWKKDELINLTFSRMLDRVVEKFPDQYCFKFTTLDYTRTYEEFRTDVDNFARALISIGVRPGTKVAIWATNVPAWYITFWATVKIGAVLVTVNTAYKSHEAEYLLRQSDTHTLVMIESALDADFKGIINGLCPEIVRTHAGEPLHCKRLPFLRNVITVGFKQPGCMTFEEVMARKDMVTSETLNRMASSVKPDDVCNMQYTSGTTGFPKGVMLTHYNVVNNGKCIGDRMGLSTADIMMIQVPMFHCFGLVLSMTASMTHGATMCPMPYFSAKASLACINQERVTCFNGVPTMFIAMFSHPDYATTDFSHMRTGIMAGAGCPPELMRRAALPQNKGGMNMRGIVSVYGQTESAPGSTMSAWTDSIDIRTDTVGYAFPHVECKVINPETGAEVPDGQNGEFCSRGYNTMKGYYKMPEETRETVDAEGWLHSGDLACRDSRGCYAITGRLKDMIIRGGENIYPKEIEEFIYTNPLVKDVQVIAVPDERYGEEALACIILKEKGSTTEEEMRNFIKASLARHKVPRYIEFVDTFPMNAAGKVLKYKMREAAVKKYGLKK